MAHQIATIVRYTVLEAIRTRLPYLLLALVPLVTAAGLFISSIAIAESARMQTGAYAYAMRLTGVFIAAL